MMGANVVAYWGVMWELSYHTATLPTTAEQAVSGLCSTPGQIYGFMSIVCVVSARSSAAYGLGPCATPTMRPHSSGGYPAARQSAEPPVPPGRLSTRIYYRGVVVLSICSHRGLAPSANPSSAGRLYIWG